MDGLFPHGLSLLESLVFMDEGLSLALITVHDLYSVVQVGSGNTSFSTEKDTCVSYVTLENQFGKS